MGGNSSPFRINVDGTPEVSFSDVELEANDSVYVFVSVTINPTAANLPFIVQDSILVNYNGNDRFLQLQAFGQNAHFLRNQRITKDSAWNNDLPFVILGNVTVDEDVSLTINKGCRVYAHADAPFIVNGSLKVNGEADSRVIFQGDRLDPEYRDLPAAWPGISFSSTSSNNVLNYATIKNAYQGIITESAISATPKITLNQCIIHNIYDAGILSLASSIKATNLLISNCGSNIAISGGGNYSFTHCTVATYGSIFNSHKNPVLFISNAFENQIIPLKANFTNCIFYGEGGITENEIVIDKKGSPDTADFDIVFENVLYKNKKDQPDATFINEIRNQPPEFDSIDVARRYFDFRLQPTSLAIDAGAVTNVTIDLNGNPRGGPAGKPDLGCYEQ